MMMCNFNFKLKSHFRMGVLLKICITFQNTFLSGHLLSIASVFVVISNISFLGNFKMRKSMRVN